MYRDVVRRVQETYVGFGFVLSEVSTDKPISIPVYLCGPLHCHSTVTRRVEFVTNTHRKARRAKLAHDNMPRGVCPFLFGRLLRIHLNALNKIMTKLLIGPVPSASVACCKMILDFEGEGHTFHRNIGPHINYTSPHPRRR
jgi:hypothetical protein